MAEVQIPNFLDISPAQPHTLDSKSMNMVLQKRPSQDAGAGNEVFRVLGILQDPLAFDPSNHHMMQGSRGV
jgi:hypothetical protein